MNAFKSFSLISILLLATTVACGDDDADTSSSDNSGGSSSSSTTSANGGNGAGGMGTGGMGTGGMGTGGMGTGGMGTGGMGTGGMNNHPCAPDCTALFDCTQEMSMGMQLCPGISAGDEAVFVDGCTMNAQCNQLGLLLGMGCESAINTLKGFDASFAMLCDGN